MVRITICSELKYIKHGYKFLVNHILTIILILILIKILSMARLGSHEIYEIWNYIQFDLLQFLGSFLMILFVAMVYYMSKPPSVYLVDYACFKPPASYRFPHATFSEHLRLNNKDNPEIVEFQRRVMQRSGLGDETCLAPANLHIPPTPTLEASRIEAELILFTVIDDLLKKTGTMTKNIDILIVNCCIVSPTPSLSDMVINKYKLRSNIKCFNLSGMGCSASLISIDLARKLLQLHPNSCALVVSTEITTPNYYSGNDRSMVLVNCLFRMGGAAMLLSNKREDRRRSKYKLLHLVRTHTGADDEAYRCIHAREDREGIKGVSLSKTLMMIAGKALKTNITTIGPLVLPVSEQLRFLFFTLIIGHARKILKLNYKWNNKVYIPDFKKAFEHLCIHAGGRGVIDEMQKQLKLSDEDVEASRMTLHRFGNVSSSSIWYEMNYMECKGWMKKGDRVWQVAFGSGFKCNSVVWKCNATITTPTDGPWLHCVDRYPMSIG